MTAEEFCSLTHHLHSHIETKQLKHIIHNWWNAICENGRTIETKEWSRLLELVKCYPDEEEYYMPDDLGGFLGIFVPSAKMLNVDKMHYYVRDNALRTIVSSLLDDCRYGEAVYSFSVEYEDSQDEIQVSYLKQQWLHTLLAYDKSLFFKNISNMMLRLTEGKLDMFWQTVMKTLTLKEWDSFLTDDLAPQLLLEYKSNYCPMPYRWVSAQSHVLALTGAFYTTTNDEIMHAYAMAFMHYLKGEIPEASWYLAIIKNNNAAFNAMYYSTIPSQTVPYPLSEIENVYHYFCESAKNMDWFHEITLSTIKMQYLIDPSVLNRSWLDTVTVRDKNCNTDTEIAVHL